MMPWLRAGLVTAGLLAACGGGPTDPGATGSELSLAFQYLPALESATEGRYEAWLVTSGGERVSAGSFVPAGTAPVLLTLPTPVRATVIEISLEPPGDTDPGQAAPILLRGEFAGGRAELEVDGAVTQGGAALIRQPGQFTMFTPSDNPTSGYPSHEESGIWLFNMAPRDTPQNDMWVRLSPLQAGWTYEGWMVRDHATAQAIWLSYGKFLPDQTGAVNTRDDTGWGAYSGVPDFRTAGEEEFPGDDWIANPLGFPLPGGLALPLDLREKDNAGRLRWTHVITVEPVGNRGEPIGDERPFPIRPYRDLFGDGPPGGARTITFREDGVPRGSATLR